MQGDFAFSHHRVVRMPPRCKAPKCAEVANKCACPNPWVEFLSKNAHKGKTTMAQHSAAYKALKDSGAFAPKAGMNNGGCKSDPVKLCAWKLRRKAGHKDIVSPVLGRDKRRDKERADRMIKRTMRTWKFSRTPADVAFGLRNVLSSGGIDSDIVKKSKLTEKELLDFFAKEMEFDKRGIKLDAILGSGCFGTVVEGTYKGKPAAVKFVWMDKAGDMHQRQTDIEVHNHKLMCKALPDMVPKLYKAFKLKGKVAKDKVQEYVDVIVMEKLEVNLSDTIHKHKKDVKFLRHVARQCKKIVMALRDKKIVHGDLHHGNMGYKLVNGLPKLYMFDFSHVRPMTSAPGDYHSDSDSIWDSECFPDANDPWPQALTDVGFPVEVVDSQIYISPSGIQRVNADYYAPEYWTPERKVPHIPLS
jgi:hypothetical protein